MNKQPKISLFYLFAMLTDLIFFAVLILYFWYPYGLIQAVGAKNILLTVFAVNASLAFVLSFLIFNNTNNKVKKNLLIALFIQLLVLFISFYAIYKLKPVWIAYNVDRFELILNSDLLPTKSDSNFEITKLYSPQFIGVTFAKDLKVRNQEMFDEALNGISLAQRPQRYVPFAQVNNQLKNRAQDLNKLEKFNDKKEIANVLSKYPQANSFVPLQARAKDMTVLLNKNSNEPVVAIVDLRPW